MAKVRGKANNKDINFMRLIDSMETMLGSIDNESIQIQACSISIVPDQLRKSNEDAYMPKVVSIGPLHRGTKRDLLYMEEIKWRCMRSLLNRKGENARKRLRKCSKAMFDLNEVVRASYVGDIKLNDYDLAKIMLLDGCFLLELLISGSEKLNTELECSLKSPGPGAEVRRKEEVLSDLTVLGNQIPLIILSELSTLLFPCVFREKDGGRKVKEHALSLLGYSPDSSINYGANAAHFLELFHSFITGKLGKEMAESKSSSNTRETEKKKERNNMSNSEDREEVEEIQESKHLSISMESEKAESKVKKNHLELKLKRCATRLKAAGVTIEPLKPAESRRNNPAPTEFRFDFGIEFSDRKLEIPPLHITKTTEVKWRNFIAWEQNRTDHAKFVVLEQSGTRISCKFSSYALFFQGLICCEHDIELLKDRKVIVVHDEEGSNQDRKKKNKMSNEDLLNFFSKITEGVQIDMDSSFSKHFEGLNAYKPAVDRARENRIIVWHYCRRVLTRIRYICRNWYAVLIRDHIPTVWKLVAVLAATALLGLTIAQTIFAARSQ